MLDEVKLGKEFVEFLNRKSEETGKAEANLVELLTEYTGADRETIEKELDNIVEEISQALEGDTRAKVLFSSLKALKEEPTLEDFVKLYYITLAFQILGREGVIEALKGEKAEEILAKAGREDLIKRKVGMNFHLTDGGLRVELEIPADTLNTVVEKLYAKAREERLAGAPIDAITPLLLLGMGEALIDAITPLLFLLGMEGGEK